MNSKNIKEFVSLRRDFIKNEFKRMNDRQIEAVLATEGPLLLLAGAGSGKTTVLINRAANLLRFGRASDSDDVPEYVTDEDFELLKAYMSGSAPESYEKASELCRLDPARPWEVIAITFTNKAAGELKERLEKMLGPEANDIWAMTFHSACARILRRDADRLGYGKDFTIYDTADTTSLMKKILKDLSVDDKAFPPKAILASISRAKDEMISASAYAQEAEKSYDVRKKTTARAYTEYEKRLFDANAVDFDDLILLTVRLLLENEDVRTYYQNKFRYVLVDEYQDTNKLQYLLASTIAHGRDNICVVGDDDQSIYKFRGATIENILNFENQYKHARVIRLEQNYRSTGHILAASNAVIRNNIGRKGKELWTDKGNGEKLRLFVAGSESDEAQFVAGQVLAGVAQGSSWDEFAVLYRMNAQSSQLEYAFKRNGIPYKVFGGMRFFDRAEVKDMLAYLCVVSNPNDDLRLARIINNPPRGIGQKSVETAMVIASERGVPLFEIVSAAGEYGELKTAAAKMEKFAEMITGLKKLSETTPPDMLYDMIVEASGYVRSLEEKQTLENQTRIENVNELKSSILGYMKEQGDETPTLEGFLDEVALYTDLDSAPADGAAVSMMTIHSAKGLEFDTVFIVGMEDGLFPGTRSIGEPEEMEEERRLCYVAMTRARKKLYLTAARSRMLFGKTTSNRQSRFIEEIPDENIDKPAPKKPAFTQFGSPEEHKWSGEGGSYGDSRGSYYDRPSAYSKRKPPYASDAKKDVYGVKKPAAPETPAQSFKTGDSVRHKAFGNGVITSMTPMGTDALIEINFEGIGVKRLMLKAASKHMEKTEQ